MEELIPSSDETREENDVQESDSFTLDRRNLLKGIAAASVTFPGLSALAEEIEQEKKTKVEVLFGPGPHAHFKIETNLGTEKQGKPVNSLNGVPRSLELPIGPNTIDVLTLQRSRDGNILEQGGSRTFRVIQNDRVSPFQESPYPIDVKQGDTVKILIGGSFGRAPWPERKGEPEAEPGKPVSSEFALEGDFHPPYTTTINGKSENSFDGKALENRELKVGENTISLNALAKHYPQPYRLEIVQGNWTHKSSRRVNGQETKVNLHEGQKLRIIVEEPIETYDKSFFTFRDRDCVLTLVNAYAHFRIEEDRPEGTYPNPLIAIAELGVEEVAKKQAEFVADKLYIADGPTYYDLRSPMEVGFLTPLTADNRIDPAIRGCTNEELKTLPKGEVQKRKAAFIAELTKALIPQIQYILKKGWRTRNATDTRKYQNGIPVGVFAAANHYFGDVPNKRKHWNKEQELKVRGEKYLAKWREFKEKNKKNED